MTEHPHDRILDALEISAEPFAICALEGACSMGLGRTPRATLHYVLGGRGVLSVQGGAPLDLAPGRLVLVPASRTHSLAHRGGGQVGLPACHPAGLDLEAHVARGEGAGVMVVLCSTISVGLRGTHGLIDLLRAPLDLDVTASPVAAQAMAALVAEMGSIRPGQRAMVRALLLQCLIEMLRVRLEAGDPAVTWLAALADPGLWRGLRAMLDEPGAPHTLDSLAAAAGMSRSRFAARFRAAYGQGAMTLLRDLRLARAAQMLTERQAPVEQVARAVGFQSRSAFTRAFVAMWGETPRAFRGRPGQAAERAQKLA
ncbi:AraC family transcriptional regulator [Roseovarius nitratireducens]|uniref:AraC family transcriptional regulator n=1 Tax=Roseovarius nitratireducens TaxID=2044597 RepID=UPI000CE204AB|nr:AraC family transcriptional regulator [Roseovarius nitratireducens]